MNKIRELNQRLNRQWQKLPGFVRFLFMLVSSFGLCHYLSAKAFIVFFSFWALVFAVLLFIPENGVSSSKSQEQLPKPKDVDKQS